MRRRAIAVCVVVVLCLTACSAGQRVDLGDEASGNLIAAIDEHTVEITVNQPTPNLLTNIGGFKGMAIVQRRNVESGQIATHPVGIGPFAFERAKSGDSITLKANPHYWDRRRQRVADLLDLVPPEPRCRS